MAVQSDVMGPVPVTVNEASGLRVSAVQEFAVLAVVSVKAAWAWIVPRGDERGRCDERAIAVVTRASRCWVRALGVRSVRWTPGWLC